MRRGLLIAIDQGPRSVRDIATAGQSLGEPVGKAETTHERPRSYALRSRAVGMGGRFTEKSHKRVQLPRPAAQQQDGGHDVDALRVVFGQPAHGLLPSLDVLTRQARPIQHVA